MSTVVADVPQRGAFSAESLYADVSHFAAMGEHRTASPVDLATSEWIYGRLTDAGVEAQLDPWSLRQYQFHSCTVEVTGQTLDALPLWFPCTLDAAVNASVVNIEGQESLTRHIALMKFDEHMVTGKSSHAKKIANAAERGAHAVIASMPHASGEIFAPNVIPPHNQSPWPIPVVLIAPKYWHLLRHVEQTRESVSVCVKGQSESSAIANNVIGRVQRGDRWIVISTPQSGWFRCAGERGAGVALLLSLSRWIAGSDLPYSFMFLSNSGHEIGHMGMRHLMSQDVLPPPDQTECWIHLGSSIGTRGYRETNGVLEVTGPEPESWLYCSENMISLLQQAFSDLPHLQPQVYDRRNGEIRWVLERGYSAFALMGPQKYFHLKNDGPEVVEPALLASIAGAICGTIESFGVS